MFQVLILLSTISILFGILIFLEPQIIAFLVSAFFIITGVMGLFAVLRLKNFWSRLNK